MGARKTQKTLMELFLQFVLPAMESNAWAILVFNKLTEDDSSAHPVTRFLQRAE